jgi:hypothetical protein
VGLIGGTCASGLGAYVNDRFARRREREARHTDALRERYDKGAAAIKLYVDLADRWANKVSVRQWKPSLGFRVAAG